MTTTTNAKRPRPGLALYSLLWRSQLTKGRVFSLLVLAGMAILIAAAIANSGRGGSPQRAARVVSDFGLLLFLPVGTLVFASSTFSDLNDDGTLVYLWQRPVPRWKLAVAAYAAALTNTLPVIVLPLVAAAAIAQGGADLVVATAVSVTLGVIAYCAIFTALGLRLKRALVWGLLYIFIWEGFVAFGSETAARFAIRAYTQSLLTSNVGSIRLPLGFIEAPWTWLMPIVAAVLAVAYTTRRLGRQEVP